MKVLHVRDYVVKRLQYALNPKSIAVVGASRYETKVGYKVIEGLRAWGYKGEIYPVNLRILPWSRAGMFMYAIFFLILYKMKAVKLFTNKAHLR